MFLSFPPSAEVHIKELGQEENKKKIKIKKGGWLWITALNKEMAKTIKKNPYNYPVWPYTDIWKLCNMIIYDNLPQIY